MGESIEEIKNRVTDIFPKLSNDSGFEITSKTDASYNCIAWAYCLDNRCMWPNTGECEFLDGVNFWPSDEIMDCNIENFIKAFELKGYELCHHGNHEENYRKIALFVKQNTTECTHASRELSNGYWTSKLGKGVDIQHKDPYNLESDTYGVLYCFMRKII